MWLRAQPGTSVRQYPTSPLPSLQGPKWYVSDSVWTAASHSIHPSLQTHCERDTLSWRWFKFNCRCLEGGLTKVRWTPQHAFSLRHVINKHMNNSLHQRVFCSQGHSVWLDWNDCWTDKADKIEALVFLSTLGHEQIWWLLVYEGTISKTVIDISYDIWKLHIAQGALKWEKKTHFLDRGLRWKYVEVVLLILWEACLGNRKSIVMYFPFLWSEK